MARGSSLPGGDNTDDSHCTPAGTSVAPAYQYDEAGNRTKIVRGAQNHSVFTYDERDRLSGISHVVGGSTAASVSYTRDGVGSPTAAAWVNGQYEWTVSYSYDAMNRLTYEDHSERGDTLWSYDWVGNRLDYGFEYDAQTDWLSEGPVGVERTYDSAGNMTQKGTRQYWYNSRNLLGMTSSSGLGWDGEERLLTHSVWTGNSFVTYTWVYDPTASIPAVVQEFSSSGRNIVYIREPDGSLVARFEPGENPVAEYYYFDGLGSTVMLTEGLSTITDRYDYDAWGNEYPIMASTADNPYRYVGQLGYYTHWMDSSLSDLLHLGIRFYEPGVGRFTQVDPARDGWNLYGYVGARAMSAVDPSGMIVLAPGNWWWGRPMPSPHGPLGLCFGGLCVWKRANEALAAAQARFPASALHNGMGDAFRHCLWACTVMRDCGARAYNSGVIDHEVDGAWWADGNWDTPESWMDLANDEIGRKISASGQDCTNECYRKALDDKLYVLP